MKINKEKLIKVLKKYAGWDVEGNHVKMYTNKNKDEYYTYDINHLMFSYVHNVSSSHAESVILSFMMNYESEFIEEEYDSEYIQSVKEERKKLEKEIYALEKTIKGQKIINLEEYVRLMITLNLLEILFQELNNILTEE